MFEGRGEVEALVSAGPLAEAACLDRARACLSAAELLLGRDIGTGGGDLRDDSVVIAARDPIGQRQSETSVGVAQRVPGGGRAVAGAANGSTPRRLAGLDRPGARSRGPR